MKLTLTEAIKQMSLKHKRQLLRWLQQHIESEEKVDLDATIQRMTVVEFQVPEDEK